MKGRYPTDMGGRPLIPVRLEEEEKKKGATQKDDTSMFVPCFVSMFHVRMCSLTPRPLNMRVHTAADTVRDAAQRPLERLCERPYAKKNKTQPAAPGIEI